MRRVGKIIANFIMHLMHVFRYMHRNLTQPEPYYTTNISCFAHGCDVESIYDAVCRTKSQSQLCISCVAVCCDASITCLVSLIGCMYPIACRGSNAFVLLLAPPPGKKTPMHQTSSFILNCELALLTYWGLQNV